MRKELYLLAAVAILGVSVWGAAAETPYGKGLSEANMEALMLDDMEGDSDWFNGTPEETTLGPSAQRVKQGKLAMKFANLVDHVKGEKNYPVGWPRAGKNLAKAKRTDWSQYDFFECWIYVQTSRPALPGDPLSVGFYHSGTKRSSSFPLKQVQKDAWTRIVIPVDQIAEPGDVQRVQFNISESNYRHGDRVDFFIDDMKLTRFVDPAVAEFAVRRQILYANDSHATAAYKLAGYKDMDRLQVEFGIGQGDKLAAKATAGPGCSRQGELTLAIKQPLTPGTCWGRLSLRDGEGKLIDAKQVEFRVVQGPF